ISEAEFVTTTTHKTLRGPRGGIIMAQAAFAKEVARNVFPGIQGGPLMHVIAAKAVALKEAQSSDFKHYQEQIVANSRALAEQLMEGGFQLVSAGTDNHLMLVDLRDRELTGAAAEAALEKASITVNKNTVPFDTRSPRVTSGIRIGTPAVTTRGMKEAEMKTIAQFIREALASHDNEAKLIEIGQAVRDLCRKFPLYLN
ncbi:MAG: serine hydroxymethyltransferase, partial [Dehalococcoidales bacterium]